MLLWHLFPISFVNWNNLRFENQETWALIETTVNP
jgi:hypothetical protein